MILSLIVIRINFQASSKWDNKMKSKIIINNRYKDFLNDCRDFKFVPIFAVFIIL